MSIRVFSYHFAQCFRPAAGAVRVSWDGFVSVRTEIRRMPCKKVIFQYNEDSKYGNSVDREQKYHLGGIAYGIRIL